VNIFAMQSWDRLPSGKSCSAIFKEHL